MGKGLDKFLNIMRLNDDDYEDEYEDTYDEDYDEGDYDDEYEDEEPVASAASKKKSPFHKAQSAAPTPEPSAQRERPTPVSSVSQRSSSSRSKIVPMKQPVHRSTGMEVSIQKPAVFEDSRDICDVLLSGKAAVVNLEGIDVEVAQRIIDFISGACYAMNGNIRKVSSYIFIVTPEGIDISGDIENVISSGSSVNVPAFHLNV